MEPPPYLQEQPDGKWIDTRYRFARGDKVAITKGPMKGRIGIVDSRLGQVPKDGRLVATAGYHLLLEDQVVTVTWDMVEPLAGHRPDHGHTT